MRVRVTLIAVCIALVGCDACNEQVKRLPEPILEKLPESWRAEHIAPWEPGFPHEPAPPDEPPAGSGDGFEWYRRFGFRMGDGRDGLARLENGELVWGGLGLARLSASGATLSEESPWGYDVRVASVVAMSGGDVVMLGIFGGWSGQTIDLDPGPGVSERTPSGEQDLFIARLGADGSARFVVTISGTKTIEDVHLAVGSGAIVVAGRYSGNVRFDRGDGDAPVALPQPPDEDAFVAKLDEDGALVWAKGIGGSHEQTIHALAIAPDGDVIAGGMAWAGSITRPASLDFDRDVAGELSVDGGSGFLLRVDAQGVPSIARSLERLVTAVCAWGDDTLIATDGGHHLHRLDAAGGFVEHPFSMDERMTITHLELREGELVVAGSYYEGVDLDPGPAVVTPPTRGLSRGVFMASLALDGTLRSSRAAAAPGSRTELDAPFVFGDDLYVTGATRNAGPGAHSWEWQEIGFIGKIAR